MDTIGLPPVLLISFSFMILLLSILVKTRTYVYHYLALTASIIVFLITTYNMQLVLKSNYPIIYKMGGWPPPIGIIYEVDALSALLGVLTSLVTFLVIVYSWWYIQGHLNTPYYYSLLLGLEAGLIGIFYTGDIFNLFVMLEVTGITSYALVAYYRSNKKAIEASVKYSLFGLIAGLLYFLACVLTYSSYGTLTMGFIASLSRPIYSYVFPELSYFVWGNILGAASLILALCIWTFTFISGVFPNHYWLPDAHPAAPSPISAVLSGLVVNAGLYSLIRFFYTIFGIYDKYSLFESIGIYAKTLLLITGCISVVYASLMMIIQVDAKRLVAYSTIIHTSLIFTSISLGSYYALKASIYHIITHSIAKALLFLSVGIIVKISSTRDIREILPIGKKNPILALALILSSLSLIGVPPLAGFFSKLYMYKAFVLSNSDILIVVLLISTGLAMVGYVKLIYALVFKPERTTINSELINKTYDARAMLPVIIMMLLLLVLNPLLLDEILSRTASELLTPTYYATSALNMFIEYFLELSGG